MLSFQFIIHLCLLYLVCPGLVSNYIPKFSIPSIPWAKPGSQSTPPLQTSTSESVPTKSLYQSDLRTPTHPIIKAFKFFYRNALGIKRQPGRLILIRHGESEMNSDGRFSGWQDTELTEEGRSEMDHAAHLMIERGYIDVDMVYCSMLRRSIHSSWWLLKALNQVYRPVLKSWRLNQRMYGDLEGRLYSELPADQALAYRKSVFLRPPPKRLLDADSHRHDRRYNEIPEDQFPESESIADCFERTIPIYTQSILPELVSGKTVVVVAHANSLRGLVRHLEGMSAERASTLAIPSGIPFVYKFNLDMKPIRPNNSYDNTSFVYLEKPKVLKLLLKVDRAWGTPEGLLYKNLTRIVQGSSDDHASAIPGPPGSTVFKGLNRLIEERKLLEDTLEMVNFNDFDDDLHDDFNDNYSSNFDSSDEDASFRDTKTHISMLKSNLTSLKISLVTASQPQAYPTNFNIIKKPAPSDDGPYIVLIRHGKTEYNKLGIFTGWDDASLADEGRYEAKRAGELLKTHNFEFDVVYSSWLSRAIETAWLVMEVLGTVWLPLVKSWRLNERMYGSLTGMSKLGIGERFGEEQLVSWRRGYAVRPPPVDSFSLFYPGNDERYVKYVKDLPVSVSESIMRSLSNRRLEIHRKFPKTESLKDCMRRTIPYFTNTIIPQSVDKGQRVLIASSENAIRGLLMHLCDIPEQRIHEIDIPNGLPLIYNIKKKCIQLLDEDHNGSLDTLYRYSFGKSPELLFKPCDYNENDISEGNEGQIECFLGENGQLFKFDPLIRLPT